MNAGTREREVKDVIASVELFDPAEGEVRELARAELRFAYRKTELPPGSVVLAASFDDHARRPRRDPRAPEEGARAAPRDPAGRPAVLRLGVREPVR